MNHYSNRLVWLVLLTVAMATGMAGCGTKSVTDTTRLPNQMPTYEAGTIFVYSDGRWERVEEVTPDTVTWKTHRRTISSGSPDFTFRRAKWESRTRMGERQFEQREGMFLDDSTSLWPLEVGKEYHYREFGKWQEKEGAEKEYKVVWSLEVLGTERISVMAGEFDTWVIRGRRYNKKLRLREIKTWHYAPEINHYVRVHSRYLYRKLPRSLELLAVSPPRTDLSKEVRRIRARALQQSMEHNQTGQGVTWQDDAVGVRGTITPTRTLKLNGMFCRSYKETMDKGEGAKSYNGMVCRDGEGKWRIPRK